MLKLELEMLPFRIIILFFASLVGSVGLGEYRQNCVSLIAKINARVWTPTTLNKSKFDAYLLANDAEFRPTLRFLLENIELIDVETFRNELVASMRQFLTEYKGDGQDLLITWASDRNDHKSGDWVAGILAEEFPELMDAQFLPSYEQNKISEFLRKHPKGEVVIVDDAHYSGAQLAGTATLIESLRETLAIPQLKISAVAMASSKLAADIFSRFGKLHVQRKIRTMNEILSQAPAGFDVMGAKRWLGWIEPDFAEVSLFYFEHKAPDALSSLEFISLGRTMHNGALSNGGHQDSPIVKGRPPYKMQ